MNATRRVFKDSVVFEHIQDATNTFNFDISIIELNSRRRLVHSRKRQNKGYCESHEEKAELFDHIRKQLAMLQEMEASRPVAAATAATAAVGKKEVKSSA